MASHFISALNVTSSHKMKAQAHTEHAVDEYDPELDVETRMDVEPSSDDIGAMQELLVADFEAGDVVGKLMAFSAQLRACGEDTREYLKTLATSHGCPGWEIKLWAIDRFCILADNEDDLPPLSNGKKWLGYKMSHPEWQIIKLAHRSLEILAKAHGELSANKTPTCQKVFPVLERLQSAWEDLLDKHEYEPVHDALAVGLRNMQKWYRKTDDTSIYFISHVLDPTRKLSYIEAAWDPEFVESSMKRLKAIYLRYHTSYYASKKSASGPTNTEGSEAPKISRHNSLTDNWMDQIVDKAKGRNASRELKKTHGDDPLAELKSFFDTDMLSKDECPDVVAWFGVWILFIV
ncbi:hypothetical protein M378DRAFT_182656 [Amanita muscaria Koide BX008]|uniref:Uncharacterized protein n=1 Tax=Amanita muscaria (strain Koide BX008) TaxID=946122 RepID=A0A0C2VZ54_AMAMK|nr:hypothetical protein M378DRAFT_182656 [Amanita muscaria Koide BX008]